MTEFPATMEETFVGEPAGPTGVPATLAVGELEPALLEAVTMKLYDVPLASPEIVQLGPEDAQQYLVASPTTSAL